MPGSAMRCRRDGGIEGVLKSFRVGGCRFCNLNNRSQQRPELLLPVVGSLKRWHAKWVECGRSGGRCAMCDLRFATRGSHAIMRPCVTDKGEGDLQGGAREIGRAGEWSRGTCGMQLHGNAGLSIFLCDQIGQTDGRHRVAAPRSKPWLITMIPKEEKEG